MTEAEAVRQRFKRYIKWNMVDHVVVTGDAKDWNARCKACGLSVRMSEYGEHPCFVDYWQAEESEIAGLVAHNQGSIAKVLELAASLITSGAPLDKDPYDLIVAREPFGELGRLLQSMGLLEPIEAPTED